MYYSCIYCRLEHGSILQTVLLNVYEYLLLFQEIQIGPDHQAEVPEIMGPNYQEGE